MHERLGAAGWTRLSQQALTNLLATPASQTANEFRLANDVRLLSYQGKQVQLPDSKGLGDLAVLLGAAHGADVHVLTLVGHKLARMGADPVLDERAKAAFKSRLDDLAHEIDNADAAGNPEKAEALRSERDALIRVRDGLAVFAEPGEVELDGLPHLVQDSFFGICERDAARQVRAPCAVSAVVGTLDDDCVTGHGVLRFSPACLRMLRSVPGGKTALSLPATVTRPGLAGCL